MIYSPNSLPMRRPKPIGAADQALIAIRIAKHGITHIARGVSGMTIEDGVKAAFWQTKRGHKSAAYQLAQARRQQLFCNLAADGKTPAEIAVVVGVNRQAVYKAIRRLGLRINEPRDG